MGHSATFTRQFPFKQHVCLLVSVQTKTEGMGSIFLPAQPIRLKARSNRLMIPPNMLINQQYSLVEKPFDHTRHK